MRKAFILGPVVVAALSAGGLAGVASADNGVDADAIPEQVTPTTMAGDMSLDQILSILTPDQLNCLVQTMGTQDLSTMDLTAMMGLLTQCGISLDQLTGATGGVAPVTTMMTGTMAPGVVDPAMVVALLTAAGLGPQQLSCLAAGVATLPLGDDQSALLVLQQCGVSLSTMLTSLVALSGGGGATAATVATVPAIPATTLGTAGALDPMTQLFIDTFASMGMTLTPDQASCLAQNSLGVDTNDQAALMALLQTCGISINDLLTG